MELLNRRKTSQMANRIDLFEQNLGFHRIRAAVTRP
jgi:hypothetical protein